MGCSCGNRGGGPAPSYQYTSPSGAKTTYRTEVEAQAAKIRNKGGDYKAVTK